MKEIRKVLILLIAVSFTVACSSLDDDDHYSKYNTDIQNNELKIVNMSSEDYIKTRPDLSDMNDLFLSDSIYKQLDAKDQRSTILVVTNNHFKMPDAKNMGFYCKITHF
jgi:uncharacterized lipoprotein YehR (DUF1307 family)